MCCYLKRAELGRNQENLVQPSSSKTHCITSGKAQLLWVSFSSFTNRGGLTLCDIFYSIVLNLQGVMRRRQKVSTVNDEKTLQIQFLPKCHVCEAFSSALEVLIAQVQHSHNQVRNGTNQLDSRVRIIQWLIRLGQSCYGNNQFHYHSGMVNFRDHALNKRAFTPSNVQGQRF